MTQVSRASGVLRPTIYRGLRELLVESEQVQMVRLPGGGRKRIEEVDPTILDHLDQLIDPDTRGDPMSPLRWTCKSTRQLAAALQQPAHRITHQLVAELLRSSGYIQGNAKTKEGNQHPDTDAQFN